MKRLRDTWTRGDRVRDAAGLVWVVRAVERDLDRDVVTLEVSGGGLRRDITAERLGSWERA